MELVWSFNHRWCSLRIAMALFCASLGPAMAVTTVRPMPTPTVSRHMVTQLHTLGGAAGVAGRMKVGLQPALTTEQTASLRVFQSQRGMRATGTFDPSTQKALDRAFKEYAAMDTVAQGVLAGANVVSLRRDKAAGGLWHLTPQQGEGFLADSIDPVAQRLQERSTQDKPTVLFAPGMSQREFEKFVSSIRMSDAGGGRAPPPILLRGHPDPQALARNVHFSSHDAEQVGKVAVRVDRKYGYRLEAPVGGFSVRLTGKGRDLIERAQLLLAEFLHRRASGRLVTLLMPQLMADFRAYLNDKGGGLHEVGISYLDNELGTRQWAAHRPAGLAWPVCA